MRLYHITSHIKTFSLAELYLLVLGEAQENCSGSPIFAHVIGHFLHPFLVILCEARLGLGIGGMERGKTGGWDGLQKRQLLQDSLV